MKPLDNKYKCLPFWSWNGELDKNRLLDQISWMHENGVGGFFMHARSGLTTPYLKEEWFDCVNASILKAKELNMEPYAYDENGWPSGFAGRKLLEDIENHDMYITHKEGEYDPESAASFDISGDNIKKVTSGHNVMNIYLHYSVATVDILNPKVVDQFIEATHEKYYENDKKTKYLRGFFTDEPQYFRWGTPFTKMLYEYFKRNYNESVLDRIALLFVEKEGYRDYRYKYYKALQDLMLNNWAKKLYAWCDSHNYKLTGHYVEESIVGYQVMCCGGVMPFYEYEHIPGVDYLGRSTNYYADLIGKQVGSVAAQLKKEQVITETYGCCGWDVTPQELKIIAERQYVEGVNLMCQHLLPYEEHGQRKRDYPAHFSTFNPWIKENFKEFNDYFSYLGRFLATSKENPKVAIIHPVRSAYFDYKDEVFHKNPWEDASMIIDNKLREVMEILNKANITYHFIDETLLAKYGKVEDYHLVMGVCSYDFIILPYMYTMDQTTYDLLKQYVKNGGKIISYATELEYIGGTKADYSFIKNNFDIGDIRIPFHITKGKKIRFSYRFDEDGNECLYIVNFEEKSNINVSFLSAPGLLKYDVMNDTYTNISNHIELEPFESIIVYPTEKVTINKKEYENIYLKGPYKLKKIVDNYLTIDSLKVSKDGVNYGNKANHMVILRELIKERYKGDLYLKYEFDVKDMPLVCEALIEETNVVGVYLNGKAMIKYDQYNDELHCHCYNCVPFLVNGHNELVVKMNYHQSEDVYYVMNSNATEGLKNCLAFTSNIEAIYLKGHFGVYGEYKKGKGKNVLIGSNFYITEQKKKVNDLIKDGFPFVRGIIPVSFNTIIKDKKKNYKLVIPGRYQLIKVYVNDKFVKTMMFEYSLDITDYLKKGENVITLELAVSNRNLLGPSHHFEEEPLGVGPEFWEVFNNEFEPRKDFSLIKTII